jgi:Family of unknown function (DUF6178)
MPKRADPRRRPGNRTKSLGPVSDASQLAHIVSRASPEILHHLIRHRGLEACGPIVAAATPRQLASILDLDLWRTAPGARTDRLDERRFGAWLEVLMDEGEAVAAGVVAAMDRSLAIVGLSRYVRVFDPGVLASVRSGHDCEIGGYVVRARTPHAWDAIVGLLVTLSSEQPDCFHSLMQGCRRLSNSTPEADGLDDLMLAPEQLLHDVSLDRELRRTELGYLTVGDAGAFLDKARRPQFPGAGPAIDPIAAAYFRTLDDAMESDGEKGREDSAPSSMDRDVAESLDAVIGQRADAGIALLRPRALIGSMSADAARLTPIQPLMEYVHDTDQAAYFVRNRELAFLANALLAGCTVHSRPFTVQEAWDAAVAICNLGLEISFAPSTDPKNGFLVDHDLVTAFESGWRLLHKDVSMFVAERLIVTLADFQTVDPETERDLYKLRRELQRNGDAGTPWRVREALDVIAILDTPAWACLRGLLSECPVSPAALTAILEGHTRSVSATAFEWFSTTGMIRRVHDFAERLGVTLLQ